MKTKVKYVVPAACILVGALFVYLSWANYEIYSPTKGPMTGFMPLAIGLLMVLVGILDLFQVKNSGDAGFKWDNWFFVICVLATVGASYLIGLLPAGYVFAFCWLKFKERCSWKVTLITMAFLLVLVLGVFVFWLDIPFEYGLLSGLLG